MNTLPSTVIAPVRLDVELLAATVKPTVPGPLPDAPLVTVSQPALLTADHGQPAGDVTASVELTPADVAENAVDASDVEQAMAAWNWFDTALTAIPPGPDATTRASYMRPGVRATVSFERNSTRIFPSASADGLPMFRVWMALVCPDT